MKECVHLVRKRAVDVVGKKVGRGGDDFDNVCPGEKAAELLDLGGDV